MKIKFYLSPPHGEVWTEDCKRTLIIKIEDVPEEVDFEELGAEVLETIEMVEELINEGKVKQDGVSGHA